MDGIGLIVKKKLLQHCNKKEPIFRSALLVYEEEVLTIT